MRPSRAAQAVRPVAATLLVALLAACASGPDAHVDARELAARIADGTAPLVVDVRSEGEYRDGHVPGAVHVSFLSTFGAAGARLAPPGEPVVLYCEHGPRAGIARFALHRHGFDRVILLEGHMTGWREQGLPIEVPEAAPESEQGAPPSG